MVSGVLGGWEALDDVTQEGLPLGLRHGALGGRHCGVGGGAVPNLLGGVEARVLAAADCSPRPLDPPAELTQCGHRPPVKVSGGGRSARVCGDALEPGRGGEGCRRWPMWGISLGGGGRLPCWAGGGGVHRGRALLTVAAGL